MAKWDEKKWQRDVKAFKLKKAREIRNRNRLSGVVKNLKFVDYGKRSMPKMPELKNPDPTTQIPFVATDVPPDPIDRLKRFLL